MASLTAAERAAYENDGFFVREAILGGRELTALREAAERVHRQLSARAAQNADKAEETLQVLDGKRYQRLRGSTVKWEWAAGSDQIRSMEPVHHSDAILDAILDDVRLWRPAAELLGVSRLSLFTDKLNFKRPAGSPFPWHQDTPYWAFDCDHVDQLRSVQLYLDAATEENGCLWVMPGSQRAGVRPGYSDRGVLARLYTRLEGLERFERVPIIAPAGSAIFFDGNLVHGSQSNRSERSRRALVITYQPPGRPVWAGTEVREIARKFLLGSPRCL